MPVATKASAPLATVSATSMPTALRVRRVSSVFAGPRPRHAHLTWTAGRGGAASSATASTARATASQTTIVRLGSGATSTTAAAPRESACRTRTAARAAGARWARVPTAPATAISTRTADPSGDVALEGARGDAGRPRHRRDPGRSMRLGLVRDAPGTAEDRRRRAEAEVMGASRGAEDRLCPPRAHEAAGGPALAEHGPGLDADARPARDHGARAAAAAAGRRAVLAIDTGAGTCAPWRRTAVGMPERRFVSVNR
jgi:hypothetical protein